MAYYVAKSRKHRCINDFQRGIHPFPRDGLSGPDPPYRSILLIPLLDLGGWPATVPAVPARAEVAVSAALRRGRSARTARQDGERSPTGSSTAHRCPREVSSPSRAGILSFFQPRNRGMCRGSASAGVTVWKGASLTIAPSASQTSRRAK
jgi:hypothetical protein